MRDPFHADENATPLTPMERGRFNLQTAGDVRQVYIDALHAADNHDFAPLIAFARS
jgi:hypothetical protein